MTTKRTPKSGAPQPARALDLSFSNCYYLHCGSAKDLCEVQMYIEPHPDKNAVRLVLAASRNGERVDLELYNPPEKIRK